MGLPGVVDSFAMSNSDRFDSGILHQLKTMNKISITGYKIHTFQHKAVDTIAAKWAFSDWDFFGSDICPTDVKGKLKYPETEEVREVWQTTGRRGFWCLENAEKALSRLRKANKAQKPFQGLGDTRYYEFRIVALTIFPSIVEVVDKDMRTADEICKEDGFTKLSFTPTKNKK